MYEAIELIGRPLTPKIANLLFAALATDTGWFRHKNTVPRSFALAEKLVAAAQATHLYEQLYEQSTLQQLRISKDWR